MPVTISPLPEIIATTNADGTLSPIPVSLQIQGGSLNGSFTYSATISYSGHGRQDSASVQGQSSTTDFTVDFGGAVLGGMFSLVAQIPCLDDSQTAQTVDFDSQSAINGTNPDKETVKARLGDIATQLIAYQESKFKQFNGSGLPLFGPPNGFGIMQIDTPAPTATQVWSWTENVDAGLQLFAQKQADAQGFPGRVRNDFPNATDFTPDQLKMESWQRYNGGGYWQWDDANSVWTEKHNSGYADKLAGYEQAVNAGNPPAGW